MESGYISLQPLYTLAGEHDYPAWLNQPRYAAASTAYLAARDVLLAAIPNLPGWYLWLDVRQAAVVYVGKSGKGPHAGIRRRLSEEFADERSFVWHTVDKLYERHYQGKYAAATRRAMRKKGTTHIIWVSQPGLTALEVATIESRLIRRFQPRANRRREQGHDEVTAGSFEEAVVHFERRMSEILAEYSAVKRGE